VSAEDLSSPVPSSVAISSLTQRFREDRHLIVEDVALSAAQRRERLVMVTDRWLSRLFDASGARELGAALVAVGGYGRAELTAGSDLDVMLLIPESAGSDVIEIADRLWYPAWDSRIRIDHSVRTPAQARRLATEDFKVILGLLDARCVAGDNEIVAGLRSSVLADWRALAPRRLGGLHESVRSRQRTFGDLAHVLEPDIKEAYGGLRDATVLRAVAASWVTDVPRAGLASAHDQILEVRDALHEHHIHARQRPTDRLAMQDHDAVAQKLGFADPDDLLRSVSVAARTVAYASDVMWHRVERLITRPSGMRLRRRVRQLGPQRVPLAEGVVVHNGEVTLAESARPDRDPVLILRAAAAAAQAGLQLSPAAVQRLAHRCPPMSEPWSPGARDALVSLLGSGRGLVPVWEALDSAGIPQRLLPEWSVVRSAPQRNPLHTFTVDRHLIETAANAGAFVRRVSRPDLLLVGAWLHDIGKARPGDHTDIGVALMEQIAPRLGFDRADTLILVNLVRHHLLLPDMATRRDIDDPATIEYVAEAVGDVETLDVLHALTEADAAATGPAAWSEWKKGLIDSLVRRVHAVLVSAASPHDAVHPDVGSSPQMDIAQMDIAQIGGRDDELLTQPGLIVDSESVGSDGECIITVVSDDRLGLLATVAGVLALHRLQVRSADTSSHDGRVLSRWRVVPLFGDPPPIDLLRSDLGRAVTGAFDVAGALARRDRGYTGTAARPWVEIIEGASSRYDVLEVRAHDEPGLLHRIATALAAAGAYITAARVATLGSEVVDVFYLRRPDGRSLGVDHLAAVRTTVLASLTDGGAHPAQTVAG
jgi:[protein-PII] uridylyltransferase